MPDQASPFRFYDNRQKYLAFVTACNEKWNISVRAAEELAHLTPQPPAMRIFDAGMGDGTVLAHVLRAAHRRFPTTPFYVSGKEISLEDLRLCLDKLPDRLVEHPHTVFVATNMHYAEAPWLLPNTPEKRERLNWITIELEGSSSYDFGEQFRSRDADLVDGWQVSRSPKTGNPLYVRPSALVAYRADHRFALDALLPRPEAPTADYDMVLASQPWRANTTVDFKVARILAPLARSLRSGGRLFAVQSAGNDPGMDLIRRIWPDENPFQTDRHTLLDGLAAELGDDAGDYDLRVPSDDESMVRYTMHTLPSAIDTTIGTSTLFAAWNAAIYVAQIDDERLEEAMADGSYLETTASFLKERDGLWFNDETFVVRRV